MVNEMDRLEANCTCAHEEQTPSSLLDGESDWKLTALARRRSGQSPSPSSKLEGVVSFAILSALCSRQSRSPSSKLEGVESIRKHRQRRETKPFPADGPKTYCQYQLFLSLPLAYQP